MLYALLIVLVVYVCYFGCLCCCVAGFCCCGAGLVVLGLCEFADFALWFGCYMYEFGVSLFCVAVLRCCHVNSVGHVRSGVVLVIRLF